MPLVDYSSSSSDDRESAPAKKKRKTSSSSPLPPLPAAFHDLYAATVRTTPHDDPSLHQGRRRLHPHVAGHWPSHVYVEWHPTAAQHALLTRLVADVQASLSSSSSSSPLTSFLTSDLATPLPLHISLSRPLVLRTEDKDAFLNQITDALLRASSSFDVAMHDLSWFRNPGGHRSFLVLRVRSSSSSEVAASSSSATSTKDGGAPAAQGNPPLATNPELTALLTRCNHVVAQYGQSPLYSRRRRRQPSNENAVTSEAAPRDADTRTNVQPGTKEEAEEEDDGDDHGDDHEGAIDPDAFHVSIAWSFAKPTPALQERTAAVFQKAEFQRGILGVGDHGQGGGDGIKIPVDSVKVKIGNVVTSVALADNATTGARATPATSTTRRGLFGI